MSLQKVFGFFFIALCNGKENPNNSVLAIAHQGTVITWIFQFFTFTMWNDLTLLFLCGTRRMVKVRLFKNTIWWEMREFVLSWACNLCFGNREITSHWERRFLKEKMECSDMYMGKLQESKTKSEFEIKESKINFKFWGSNRLLNYSRMFYNKTLCY